MNIIKIARGYGEPKPDAIMNSADGTHFFKNSFTTVLKHGLQKCRDYGSLQI